MKVRNAYRQFNNNATPKIFPEIMENIRGSERLGNKAQFKLGSLVTSFSISPSIDKVSCRQYYESSNGLLTFVVDENQFYYFAEDWLHFSGGITRYASDGMAAYGVKVYDTGKYDKKLTTKFNKLLKSLI
jgi:uncharacterized protein YneR